MDSFCMSTEQVQNCRDEKTILLLTDIEAANSKLIVIDDNELKIFKELKELILQGDSENLLVKLLEYKDFSVDSQDPTNNNYSLLHHASEKRREGCMQILMEFSANPNSKSYSGLSPIHLLVNSDCRCESCSERIVACLQILIDGGANVDVENKVGETPLYYAARNSLNDPAELLLANGADINHWVDGTSVATILAQYAPDVLKTEFDKRIIVDNTGGHKGLRLDFRLLLQEVAIHEGFTRKLSPSGKGILSTRWTQGSGGSGNEGETRIGKMDGISFQSSNSSMSSSTTIPPKETELLNYLLRADLVAIEAVVNHPLVEAFVHLKWLSVRRLFFLFRSLYLFLILVYTFYVFDTFVNATCFYTTRNTRPVGGAGTSNDTASLMLRETMEKATFGSFIPTGSGNQQWKTFSEYFKAHEMTCEPKLRTTVMAYLFAAYAVIGVLYELYKMCESWYDYLRTPLNISWWILSVNMGITVVPGLGIYSHSWFYPYAAFSLVYGWILVLAQIGRIPYFGVFVGIFQKVLKDFVTLLFTFSPVLLAFALGFSVMLPQNEFFRSIPLSFFKVFLMMTGDVDFWGVFRETWAMVGVNRQHAYVYIPLFFIYSAFILMVTMVLMSLLLGLAVNDIQEVRREASLKRTVRLIQEIGIFESILQKPILAHCGCSKFFTRLFSITSQKCMNGPELITYPENSQDCVLPLEIKQKLLPYLKSCCCSNDEQNNEKEIKRKGGGGGQWTKVGGKRTVIPEKVEIQDQIKRTKSTRGELNSERSGKSNSNLRRQMSETSYIDPLVDSSREMLYRDLIVYHEVKLLLNENEKMRESLELLKHKLIKRK